MGKRNPNGYGCVTKLKGNRSRPYVIKVTQYDEEGNAKQVPVDYAETEEKGNIILAKYNDNPWNIDRKKVTLVELYNRWEKIKLPKLGTSLQTNLKSAFKHCKKYYGMKYRQLRLSHMQDCIDNCGKGYSTQGHIKNLWGHLDRFAYEYDIIDKMYSPLTESAPTAETTREPFTDEQVDALWAIKDEPWVDSVLIYMYTGFRLNELLGMKVEHINLEEEYFRHGSKTASGKDRIVPIHPRIMPFVKKRISEGNQYLFSVEGKKLYGLKYYSFWDEVMIKINVEGKTPHECRHTFRTRLDNANANAKCTDLLMGHKSKDIGNRTYNHKTLKQLKDTILLLK